MSLPPYLAKSSRGKVLSEEVYTEALSQIIERDFFPDIAQMQDGVERLRNDVAGVVSVPLNPECSAAAFMHTPVYCSDSVSVCDAQTAHVRLVESSGKPVETVLNIDEFQAKYTSEDNASFHKLLDESNRRKLARIAYIYKNQPKPPTIGAPAKNPMLMPSKARGTSNTSIMLRGPLREPPGLLLLKSGEQHDSYSIPSTPSWIFKVKNNLMFAPESNREKTKESALSDSERMPPPKKSHVNTIATRFNSANEYGLPCSEDNVPRRAEDIVEYSFLPMTPLRDQFTESEQLVTYSFSQEKKAYHIPDTPRREEVLSIVTGGTLSCPSTPMSSLSRRSQAAGKSRASARAMALVSASRSGNVDSMLRESYSKYKSTSSKATSTISSVSSTNSKIPKFSRK